MNKQLTAELTTKLLQALLGMGLCVDDILQPQGDVDLPKGRETLLHAYKRKFTQLEGGDVTFAGVTAHYDEFAEVFRKMDYRPPSRNLGLAKIVSMPDVQEALALAGMPAWKNLSEETKEEVLWGMGLAVKFSDEPSDDEDASVYYIDRKQHRNVHNKVVLDLCITANERVDTEWLSSPHCSHAAKIFTKDVELSRELAEIGRTY